MDALLHLFAEQVSATCTVLELDPGPAALVLVVGDAEHRLYLPRPLLEAELRHMEQHGDHPWGGVLEPVEAVARLMSIHLDESLATRTPHESGWWSYGGGFFEPEPPWEVPHR